MDYLEDTRRRFWGKRDGFTWYFGALMPLFVLTATPALVRAGDWLHIASNAVWFVVAISYLTLHRPARLALLVLNAADLLFELVLAGLGLQVVVANRDQQNTLPIILFVGLLSLLLAISAYYSPRNKLAFRIPLADHELQRVYDRYLSNPLALRAAVYGLLAFFLPFVSAVTLFMGVRALRRADSAWPPRGGRLPAQIGIAVSVLGLLAWGFLLARSARHLLH